MKLSRSRKREIYTKQKIKRRYELCVNLNQELF